MNIWHFVSCSVFSAFWFFDCLGDFRKHWSAADHPSFWQPNDRSRDPRISQASTKKKPGWKRLMERFLHPIRKLVQFVGRFLALSRKRLSFKDTCAIFLCLPAKYGSLINSWSVTTGRISSRQLSLQKMQSASLRMGTSARMSAAGTNQMHSSHLLRRKSMFGGDSGIYQRGIFCWDKGCLVRCIKCLPFFLFAICLDSHQRHGLGQRRGSLWRSSAGSPICWRTGPACLESGGSWPAKSDKKRLTGSQPRKGWRSSGRMLRILLISVAQC